MRNLFLVFALFFASGAYAEIPTIDLDDSEYSEQNDQNQFCQAVVVLDGQRFFNNQNNANNYCRGMGQFRNFCSVQRSGRGFLARVNGQVRANAGNFLAAIGNIFNALNNNGLLDNIFNFVLQLINGADNANC